jgi:hypothetical protein
MSNYNHPNNHPMGQPKNPHETPPHKKNNNKVENLHKFKRFNVILIGSVVGLYLISRFLPSMPKRISSPLILNHILPLLYFAIFSFFFGSIFLIGNTEMKGYLLDHFSNQTLDIGIIAAYTGAASVIMAIFIKNIIQTLLGVKILSSPIHDVFGFIIGRIILLSMVGFFNLQ